MREAWVHEHCETTRPAWDARLQMSFMEKNTPYSVYVIIPFVLYVAGRNITRG